MINVHNGTIRRLRRCHWVCGESYFFYAVRTSFLLSLFVPPSFSLLPFPVFLSPSLFIFTPPFFSLLTPPWRQLTHPRPQLTSYTYFETIIRYLGSLVSTHAHSSPILRSKADLRGCSCPCLIPLWGCLCCGQYWYVSGLVFLFSFTLCLA